MEEDKVGVVEEVVVKDGDDKIPESKVEERVDAGVHHGRNESEGDEVFQEAIEPSSDYVDELKSDPLVVAASANGITDGDLSSSVVEEDPTLVHEGEIFENAVEGGDEATNGENVEGSDERTNGENDVGASDERTNGEEGHGEKTNGEISVEGGDERTNGGGESSDKVGESLALENDEGIKDRLNDNDKVVSEKNLNHEVGVDDGICRDVVVEESRSSGLKDESLNVEETKTVVSNGDLVDKFIVGEKSSSNIDVDEIQEDDAIARPVASDDHVIEEVGENYAHASPVASVDNVTVNEDVNSANEVTRDVSNASTVTPSVSHGTEERKTDETQGSESSKGKVTKQVQSSVTKLEKPGNSSGSPARPAGLGRAAPLLEPAPRASTANQRRANGQVFQEESSLVEDASNGENEEGDEIREKLQMIRVKFLRLAHRLGQTPHNVVVAQVLYRLGLAEQLRARNGGRVRAFSFDRASAMAEQLEATGQAPLDFSCTIMVLGKSGVGKSATINSIFDEVKFNTDAFQMGTKKVQDVVGTVQGIKVRVIDTPGLLTSCVDQRQNEKILHSVKRFIKKSPPDIVLYLDRLDMPSRDFGDMPLLRTITEIFGPSIWFNAIVVLTHAASAPPEGPNGTASTYDMFVTQRSHAVQQAIRQAAGDMRLMNPVSLVENHLACRTNRAGQRVLPNGQVWKPHLLLLSFASKILAEANTLLKLQDTPPGKPFTTRSRAPSLPLLLSSLLQSRPQLKLPEEQFGDDDAMDDDLDESSESDEESEYDELPPFRPLTQAQLTNLSRTQRKAYYDELEYREKLFMKKQLKEDRKRRKLMKKMQAAAATDMVGEYNAENVEEESGGAASLPVPMPDLPLPASFDSDNPTHRYRCLDTSNQWLVRPALDSHGWDHDVGYEGVNVERMFVVKDKIPVSFSGQISKDKKDANLQLEVASSIKHKDGKKATTMGFDVQSVGKDMAYTLRSETRFSNRKHNKATAGISATVLGDAISGGMKLEDKLIVNNQFRMVMSGGAMVGRGDIAYGGSLEATLRDKDYPVGRFLSTLGLSVMDWHGELAIGGNIQTQIPLGRASNLVARASLNNRASGQVSLRLSSSEQIQLALIGLLPILRKLIGQNQELPFGY